MASGVNILEMHDICKHFPAVRALNNVNLEIKSGEVHALVGENGAGKSTLIKILMGVYTRTSGTIILEGKEVNIKSPIQAKAMGLGAVYQDVSLAQHLTVAENLFMGQLPKTKYGTIDYHKINSETKKILESIDVHIDPKTLIKHLSAAQQEMVSIGKMVQQNAKVVVFDEPTALLTTDETDQLFKVIKKMKNDNVGIIYISHRIEEIFNICDRATILKDGEYVDTVDIKDTDEEHLIAMMVGRNVEDMYGIEHAAPGDVALKVENLSSIGKFKDINFEVRKGQIFGMFGLVGSGRTEIVRSVFGADPFDTGKISIYGKEVHLHTPKHAIQHGMALLPEERKTQGLAMKLSVCDNTNMASMEKISKFNFIDYKKAKQIAEKYKKLLNTKTPSIDQLASKLSGGNQQKLVISKWLAAESDIFVFDEPTVGVDVGAKSEIYKVFEHLTAQGKSIIVISSYLPEVMGLADNMLIMYEGSQMGVLDRCEFNEEKILKLASGIC